MGNSLMNYDKAMYKKVHNLMDEVVFSSPEESFKVNAKNHKGKVRMPFISIWRLPDFSVNKGMYNDSYVRRGPVDKGLRGSEFPNSYINLHGLPVSLQYQLDVYATKRDVCDGLATELLLEMYENPYLDVIQTDIGEEFVQQFNLEVEDNVSDNTSITEFDETNRFYRLSLTVDIPEAVIYRIDKRNTIDYIDFKLDVE